MRLWILRVVWLTLPLTAGPAAASVLDGAADATRIVAAVLLWAAWGIGLLALLAPRPPGLTAARVVAPAFVVLAVAALVDGSPSPLASWGALAATLLAATLVADPAFAITSVNGVAYGDELRHPLRVPPGLFAGPLPIARLVVAAGVATGPVLLADGSVVAGALALVVGWPAAVLAARALHPLSRRWLVLVPAGVVVVDPLTLADPVLFVRRHVRAMRGVDAAAPLAEGALDLRLGASWGTVVLDLDGAADLVRTGRGAAAGETLHPDVIVVAIADRETFLAEAAARRVRVELA